jgi:CRP-like cAMP-binding protein
LWRILEGVVLSWLPSKEDAENLSTTKSTLNPDVLVLQRIFDRRTDEMRRASKTNNVMNHNISAVEKMKRCVRTAMYISRWKSIAKVKVVLHPPEQSMIFGLRTNSAEVSSFMGQENLSRINDETFEEEIDEEEAPQEDPDEEEVDLSTPEKEQEYVFETLRKIPLFRYCHNAQIERLVSAFSIRKYPQGAIVMKEGDAITPQSEFYVLDRGTVDVAINGVTVVSRRAGTYFGEQGLLEDSPRSAGIIAATDIVCLCLKRIDFDKLTLLDVKIRKAFDFSKLLYLYNALRKIPLLRSLSNDQVEQLVTAFSIRKYPRGANVMTEGEDITPQSEFCVLEQGTVDMVVNGVTVVSRGAGSYFGEKGLLEDSPRSASVVAATDIVCICMTRADFNQFQRLDDKIRRAFDFRIECVEKTARRFDNEEPSQKTATLPMSKRKQTMHNIVLKDRAVEVIMKTKVNKKFSRLSDLKSVRVAQLALTRHRTKTDNRDQRDYVRRKTLRMAHAHHCQSDDPDLPLL